MEKRLAKGAYIKHKVPSGPWRVRPQISARNAYSPVTDDYDLGRRIHRHNQHGEDSAQNLSTPVALAILSDAARSEQHEFRLPPRMTALGARRGGGMVSFFWFRIVLTIPARIDGFVTDGAKVVLTVNVDDYAEVWVNGVLPWAAGRPSPAAIPGFTHQSVI
jgi:hypothetical protein